MATFEDMIEDHIFDRTNAFLEDEGSIKLKEGIDMNDLQDPKQGVLFEIDPDDLPVEKEPTSNSYFDKEEIFHNLLIPDDGDQNTEDGLEPFESMMKRMEDISGDEGVWKKILKTGTGSIVPEGSLVRIHYNAYKEYDDEPFDSTRLRQQIEKFRLGKSGTVLGLQVAVRSMRKGELSRFIFKPSYFFGKMGSGSRIPPNSTVLFEIELLSFVEQEGVDDYNAMTEEERKQVTLEHVCKVSKAEREEGNQCFNNKMYNRALGKYKRSAKILENYHLKNAEEEKQVNHLMEKTYLNIAQCCLNLGHNGRAITYCNSVLQLDPKSTKAWFRKGKALKSMGEFDQARQCFRKAQWLESGNIEIRTALKDLDECVRKFCLQEKDFYKKMFPKGPTEIEDHENEKKNCEVEDKCSPEFADVVTKTLQKFKNDADQMEFPFPNHNLTPAEVACILETADSLGLGQQWRGTGSTRRMVILKKQLKQV